MHMKRINVFPIAGVMISFVILIGNGSAFAEPAIKDKSLKIELLTQGLSFPTSMLFLDAAHILVLEKGGKVRLVSEGALQPEPVLTLNVINKNERGLLGVERIVNNVFLYFTEDDGGAKNRVYKFDISGTSLTNQKMILDLPAGPGTNHQGGKLVAGIDKSLYSVTGELQRNGKDQN